MRLDEALLHKAAALRLAPQRGVAGVQPGGRRSPRLGRGTDLADHRPYTPGDDLRLVDWAAYARHEVEVVKLFHEERAARVTIILDLSRSMGVEDEKLDRAGTLAAALCQATLAGGDQLRLILAGASPLALDGADRRAWPRIRAALQAAVADGPPLRRSELLQGPADRALLISDLLADEEPTEQLLAALARAGRHRALLQVLGKADLRPKLDGALLLEDAETGEQLAFDGEAALSRRYATALAQARDRLAARAAWHQIELFDASADHPLDALLFDLLPRRGLLRPGASS